MEARKSYLVKHRAVNIVGKDITIRNLGTYPISQRLAVVDTYLAVAYTSPCLPKAGEPFQKPIALIEF